MIIFSHLQTLLCFLCLFRSSLSLTLGKPCFFLDHSGSMFWESLSLLPCSMLMFQSGFLCLDICASFGLIYSWFNNSLLNKKISILSYVPLKKYTVVNCFQSLAMKTMIAIISPRRLLYWHVFMKWEGSESYATSRGEIAMWSLKVAPPLCIPISKNR